MLWDTLGLTSDAAHHDQTTSNLQVLVRLAGHEELSSGVDLEDAVELLLGDILDVSKSHNSRVGSDNVKLAKVLDGLLEERDDLWDDGDVGLDGDGVTAGFLDDLDDLLSGVGAVGVVDDNFGSTTAELAGHLTADTAS